MFDSPLRQAQDERERRVRAESFNGRISNPIPFVLSLSKDEPHPGRG